MIAKLTGRVDEIAGDHAVIDVSGVGYEVFAPTGVLQRLGHTQERVTLYIETHVREDHIHLYGFDRAGERQWFRQLTTVQGVGARGALAILSVLDGEALTKAIAAQDVRRLSRADGVGKKLAQRIAAELKDKAGEMALGPAAAEGGPASAGQMAGVATAAQAATTTAEASDLAGDALSALVNLGYRRSEAMTAVASAQRQLAGGDDLQALIKTALKELSA